MSILALLISTLLGINTAKKNAVNDIEKKAVEQGKILENIENIKEDIKNIRSDIKIILREMKMSQERANKALIITEQIQRQIGLN